MRFSTGGTCEFLAVYQIAQRERQTKRSQFTTVIASFCAQRSRTLGTLVTPKMPSTVVRTVQYDLLGCWLLSAVYVIVRHFISYNIFLSF